MGRRIGTPRHSHPCIGRACFSRAALLGIGVLGTLIWAGDSRAADAGTARAARQALAQGRELFEREWLPGDSRAHGGDGLGPVYNDSSCVSCHNLGGSGGGGPTSKNVDILTASPVGQQL